MKSARSSLVNRNLVSIGVWVVWVSAVPAGLVSNAMDTCVAPLNGARMRDSIRQ